MPRKYYAFISYSHTDSDWAKWLQHEFEYYKLPSTFNGREDVPSSFRPVFRDEDELSGGDLKPQILEALSDSEYLIVICSPASAQSKYVNSEIEDFLKIGAGRGLDYSSKIFPLIVEGKPNVDKGSSNVSKDLECFPEAIREIKNQSGENLELIAGDVTATGRNHAFVKILAGTLKDKHIEFAQLWDRFENEKLLEEKRKKEERDNLYIMQSQFLAERAMKVAKTRDSVLATKIALYALPCNINDSDDRPVVASAERLLRFAFKRVFCQYDKLFIPFKFISDNTIKSKSQTLNVITGAFQDIFTDTDYSNRRKMLWEVITNAGYRIVLHGLAIANSIAAFVCSFRKAIIIWDLSGKKEIGSFRVNHIESNHNLYFIFDNKYLVYSCRTETKIVNVQKPKVIFTLDKKLFNLRFDITHQRLLWLEEGHLHSFSVQAELSEKSFDFVQSLLHSFKISEDSGYIAGLNDEGIVVYNFFTNEYVTNISIEGKISSYDLFGTHLCIIHNSDGSNYISVYDIYNDKFIYQRHHEERIGHYSISTNLHYIAYALSSRRDKSYVIVDTLIDDTYSLFVAITNDTSKDKPILDFVATQNDICILYPDSTFYTNLIDESQNTRTLYPSGSCPLWKIGVLEDAMYLYSDTQYILSSGYNPQTTNINIYRSLSFSVSPNGQVIAYSRHLNLIIKSIQGNKYSVSFKDIPELISLDYEYGNNNIIFISESQLLVIHELGLSLWEINYNSGLFVKLSKTKRFVNDKLPFPIIGKYEMLLDNKRKRVVIYLGQGYFTTISLTDLTLSRDSYDISDFCSILNVELSPDEDYILCSGYREYDEKNRIGQNYIMDTLLLLRADTFESVQTLYFEKGFTVAHFAANDKILIASTEGNIYSTEFPNLQDLIDQQHERFKDCPLTDIEKNLFYIK